MYKNKNVLVHQQAARNKDRFHSVFKKEIIEIYSLIAISVCFILYI